jgi:uncharacterized protein with GYD domain
MARYVVLLDWTEQGVAKFKDSVDRYEAAQEQFQQMGVSFQDVYWTLGEHDIVGIVEAGDDESLAAALLRLGSQGNVRTRTLRAFTQDEMRGVIGKAT